MVCWPWEGRDLNINDHVTEITLKTVLNAQSVNDVLSDFPKDNEF